MRKLKWNEEYSISFELDNKKFSSPIGRGFCIWFKVEQEIKRLESVGAKKIKVRIRTWN